MSQQGSHAALLDPRVIERSDGRVLMPTNRLRWSRWDPPLGCMRELQQGWTGMATGETIWRPVETEP